MDTAIETIVIETSATVDAAVIWLHGLGADGHDFEPIVPELRLGDSAAIRFVFPHAPVRPVTINGGMAMRAWYDIISLDRDGPVDEDGIRASAAQLRALIDQEVERGIDPERIVVAGFSQGGAIALHAAFRYPRCLAGVMALSTYLPLPLAFAEDVVNNADVACPDLPVFMAHGRDDPMLPMALGQESADLLTGAGYPLEWHDYPMGHSVCAEEIVDIRRWLLSVLPVRS